MEKFTLWRSPVLSTILSIYSLSGNYTNILRLVRNDGVDFKVTNCDVSINKPVVRVSKCYAVSDLMFVRGDAIYDVKKKNGTIEGTIIPVNFINAVILTIQRVFPNFGKKLLEGSDDRKNFAVILEKDKKAVVKTNPMSFVLPGFLAQIFSRKRTIDVENE